MEMTESPPISKPYYWLAKLSEFVALVVIVGLAAWLRLYRLEQIGTGNPYYAAAVRSMLVSNSNFFFGSFDPTGFITVDKPPGALWAQAISAKLLGFSGLSLLLPQALIGVGCVILLYGMMRRLAGVGPSLLASLVLATTPIAVAVDRDNLPDSLLTFVLILSAATMSRAAETGRLRWLMASVALVGVGFNVKMLAAFVVLPTFYLIYFLAAPGNWLKKVGRLAAATAVLSLVSLSWCIAVEMIPKESRPYIGGSKNNSALDLALGYNGLGRVFGGSGNFRPPGGGRGPGPGGMPIAPLNGPTTAVGPQLASAIPDDNNPSKIPATPLPVQPPDGPPVNHGLSRNGFLPDGPPGRGFGRGFPGGPGMFGGPPGPFRFTGVVLAEQITWLFPFAAFGILASLFRPGMRWPLSSREIAVFVWAGWFMTHLVVFSFARGIFHEYYTIIMGPAVAALTGFGAIALWPTLNRTNWQKSLFPTALIATGAWQTYLIGQKVEFRYSLVPVVLGGVCFGATLMVTRSLLTMRWPKINWGSVGGTIGLSFSLAGPAVWSVGTALSSAIPVMPVADVSGITGSKSDHPRMPPMEMSPEATTKLLEFLRANRRGERYLVAAPSSMEVSSLIIQSGEPAISLGGFMGGDPVLTTDQFANLVKEGQLRFVMLGGGPGGGLPPNGPGQPNQATMPPGGPMGMGPGWLMGRQNSETMAWIREHGEVVEPALWRFEVKTNSIDAPPGGFGPMGRNRQLFDLNPGAGLVDAAQASEVSDRKHR
jgi:4-amino-4-deoxy-L-arabinose transferase-like glycosyltransferase